MPEYRGYIWGYAFLRGDPRLDEEERIYLLEEAILLYLSGKSQRGIETDNFAGTIKTDHKRGMIGTIAGIIFEGEIEHRGIKGKLDLSFLINDSTLEERATHRSNATIH